MSRRFGGDDAQDSSSLEPRATSGVRRSHRLHGVAAGWHVGVGAMSLMRVGKATGAECSVRPRSLDMFGAERLRRRAGAASLPLETWRSVVEKSHGFSPSTGPRNGTSAATARMPSFARGRRKAVLYDHGASKVTAPRLKSTSLNEVSSPLKFAPPNEVLMPLNVAPTNEVSAPLNVAPPNQVSLPLNLTPSNWAFVPLNVAL